MEDDYYDAMADQPELDDLDVMFGSEDTAEVRPVKTGGSVRDINIDQSQKMNDIVKAVLVAIGKYVYHVEGKLVSVERADGRFVINYLSGPELVQYVSHHCQLYTTKTDKEGNETRLPVNAPSVELRNNILGMTAIIRKYVRELRGLVTTPTLLADGRVLTQRGYDEDSGLFAVDDCALEEIVGPTLEDAEEAVDAFRKPFVDYPWKTPAEEWMYITQQLTAAARYALGNNPVPGSFINADGPGAGKSALTQCVINVNFNGGAMRSAWLSGTELEKRLVSWGIEKQQCVVFDNVKRKMDSASLEDVITSAKYGGRVLGKSETQGGSFLGLFLINGNGGTMSDDLARRFWQVHLGRQTKSHSEFQMDVNPEVYCDENSKLMKMRLITILRAYMGSGEHRRDRLVRSFEAWSRLVLAASEWVADNDGKEQFELYQQRHSAQVEMNASEETLPLQLLAEFAGNRMRTYSEIRRDAEAGSEDAKVIITTLREALGGNVTASTFRALVERYTEVPFETGDGMKVMQAGKRSGTFCCKAIPA